MLKMSVIDEVRARDNAMAKGIYPLARMGSWLLEAIVLTACAPKTETKQTTKKAR